MVNQYDNYSGSRRVSIWLLTGYLLFGILGLLLGAALVYGLFIAYLVPEQEELPLQAVDGVEVVDDIIEDVVLPEEDPPVSLVDVVEQVMPGVVGVNSHYTFSRFGEEQLQEVESGSGVIISTDGYVVTNQHVIENADKITVVIPDKGRYEAELIGADALTDLALLRIEEAGLTSVPLSNSDNIRVGEPVLAIGNPLGLQQTVTAGIISAVERQVRLPGTDYAYTLIQTDALVNPGNSGGPLVNMKGELVGINTAKVALPGVEGIGLSIPSNTVKRVVDDLQKHGKVLRPHMGVLIEDWVDYEGLEPASGVLLIEVAAESPAERAGLAAGDIIVAIEGQQIVFLAQLFDKLLAYYPGDTVSVAFFRDEEKRETFITLGERPDN